MKPADLAAEAARDARLLAIQRRAETLAQGESDERDLRVAGLLAKGEQLDRSIWRRTAEVKGPGGDTADAVLARLGVVDRQGDVVDPGCLLNPPGDRVPCSERDHSYLRNPEEPAAGFATVWEQDGELRAHVTFNDTPEGRAAARWVHDSLPDWSWGLASIETRPLTAAERAAGAVRAIHKVRVIEVSPVGRAASVASGTLSSHCASCALAGANGKCSATGGACATGGAIPPCHPRRRAMDARLATLMANSARYVAEEDQRREQRVAALVAKQRELDAAEAAEALRVAIAEDDRHRRVMLICLAAGEPLPEPWSAVLGRAPRYEWQA